MAFRDDGGCARLVQQSTEFTKRLAGVNRCDFDWISVVVGGHQYARLTRQQDEEVGDRLALACDRLSSRDIDHLRRGEHRPPILGTQRTEHRHNLEIFSDLIPNFGLNFHRGTLWNSYRDWPSEVS